MAVQYLTDDQGRRTAAVVPIEEWETIQTYMAYAEDVPPEEIAMAETSWAEHRQSPGQAKTLEQVRREQLAERDD